MTDTSTKPVRVRFAPSPTGYLHIGGARTVLFNWLVARKAGGTFILRIEDTDQTRHVEDSVAKILDDLRWLGLTWDEGPEVGGAYGPYFQSERLHLYNRHLEQLLESGHAYYALETPEELEAIRAAAKREKRTITYIRPDPLPTIQQGVTARHEGRPVVVRLRMPDEPITVVDDVLGAVTLEADRLEDFVIQKSDGFPTYHLACVVDDALMKVTHVLRGQEHLMNAPKHIALQRALGLETPRYGHLPVIFNMDGSKMSKRDKEKAIKAGLPPPEIDVHDFRAAGYLPEAVVNFISLLGWSPGQDRELFSLEEMVSLFGIDRVGKTNARFDREKLLSFNTHWAARLPADRLLAAFKDYLRVNLPGEVAGAATQDKVVDAAGVPHPVSQGGAGDGSEQSGVVIPPALGTAADVTLAKVLESCQGFRTYPDVVKKAGFLFVADDAIQYDLKAVKKVLAKNEGAGYAMLEHVLPKLEASRDWTAGSLAGLIDAVVEEKQTKLGNVAQPIRVAVSGTTISPSIHDTLVMLGRERTVARVRRCLSLRLKTSG